MICKWLCNKFKTPEPPKDVPSFSLQYNGEFYFSLQYNDEFQATGRDYAIYDLFNYSSVEIKYANRSGSKTLAYFSLHYESFRTDFPAPVAR